MATALEDEKPSTSVAKKEFPEVERVDIRKFMHDVNDDLEFDVDRESLAVELTEQLVNRENTDVVLRQGKNIVHCHSEVMCHYSELMAFGLQTGAVVDLPTSEVAPSVFPLIYKFMTNESIQCPRDKIIDLLDAGHFLYMSALVGSIFESLNDRKTFTPIHAVEMYFEAKARRKHGLADLMLGKVRKFFLLMINTEEFSQMNIKCVCNLLSSDELAVQTEIEVFYAMFVWIHVDYDVRKVYLKRLLKTIRFKFLPPAFLCTLALHLHELSSEIADLLHYKIQKTIWFHQEMAMDMLGEVFLPLQRLWIRDPECPYLDLIDQKLYIDHVAFMKYVETLDNAQDFIGRVIGDYEIKDGTDQSSVSDNAEDFREIYEKIDEVQESDVTSTKTLIINESEDSDATERPYESDYSEGFNSEAEDSDRTEKANESDFSVASVDSIDSDRTKKPFNSDESSNESEDSDRTKKPNDSQDSDSDKTPKPSDSSESESEESEISNDTMGSHDTEEGFKTGASDADAEDSSTDSDS